MKKKSLLSIIIIFIIGISFPVFQACNTVDDILDPTDSLSPFFGLGVGGQTDNNANIEDDLSLGTTFTAETLPASVDLSSYFPPIGDQGDYGTCVAWACAYNLRSFIDAKEGNYTSFTDATKYSPKDLFLSIADAGANCDGAFFEDAFDVMVSRGVATLATVPYTDLGDCSQGSASGTTNANQHKIANYRQITTDVVTIKTYLANGRAVVFGAKLGDEFMDANSDAVLSSQTYGYTGQHAYHAMILCGYDDRKGPNGAFRVVNSWGADTWGDNGFLWVDQTFFVNADEFCFGTYVAQGDESDPDEGDDGVVDDPTSGLDLMAWQLYDVDYQHGSDPTASDPRWRVAVYNVYNTGTTAIAATEDWNIIYLLYNATNGTDYEVILFDYYSDDKGSLGENGELTTAPTGVSADQLWWNYVNLPSGWSCAKAVYGSDEPFNWTYQVPNVTGDYYLVIVADGFDQFAEVDEDNNYSYYAMENGDPLHIVNGVIQNPPQPPTKSMMVKTGTPTMGQASDNASVQTKTNVNAYSPKEIQAMIKQHLRTGELQQKALKFAFDQRGVKTQYKVD